MSSSIPVTAPLNWRKHLPIHPAAELFPPMSEAELKELAEDIKNNGLQTPIVIWETYSGSATRQSQRRRHHLEPEKYQELIDGRNRLDALALLGLLDVDDNGDLCLNKWWDKKQHEWVASDRYGAPPLATNELDSGDPYAIALSFNVHRRHLTGEQKRELIAKLIKTNPEKSNRQIADQVKASHPHVAKVRAELEKTGDVETVSTSIDTKGRKQPAKRKAKTPAAEPEPSAEDSAEDSAEARRAYYTEHEEAANNEPQKKPTGRFANIANARKRTAALDVLVVWIAALPDTELRQVYEAIGVHRILADIPESLRLVVTQWIGERQSSVPPPAQAEPQDDLSIPDFMRRAP
jgi:hypothetical protein